MINDEKVEWHLDSLPRWARSSGWAGCALARFPAKSEAYLASTRGLCSKEAHTRSSTRNEGHIPSVLFFLLHADLCWSWNRWVGQNCCSTAAERATVEAVRDGDAISDGYVVAGCSRGWSGDDCCIGWRSIALEKLLRRAHATVLCDSMALWRTITLCLFRANA